MKFIALLFALVSAASVSAAETVWLDTLDLSGMTLGWGMPHANLSVGGHPLSIGGKKFARGVGTHSYSAYWLVLKGGTDRFVANVGVDDACGGPGTVIFQVSADGKNVFNSGIMKVGDAPKSVSIDLTGVRSIILTARSAYDGILFDHADWGDAHFVVSGMKPLPVNRPEEAPYILTPKPSPSPRINGPAVYGARPGHPFLYRIPTQGERPIKFSARDLPAGLTLDSRTGIITGTTPVRGEYGITLVAENARGRDAHRFKIVSGDRLALAPYMGWNSWYTYYNRVTAEAMREAADAILESGMADVGYDYVCIDDCWMNAEADPARKIDPRRIGPIRDERGRPLSNQFFPDMKGLADYLHARGLKAGLYTSPGAKTCQGFAGSYQHESEDAKQFADWGYDLLKYDWCGYAKIIPAKPTVADYRHPYEVMGAALKEQPRDIIYNLCQYGMGDVWKWGTAAGAHSWRMGYDLGHELDWFFEVALMTCALREWQKPGAWNDPDNILIGQIGSAQTMALSAPCPLTPTEQYSFMSLWALIGCPLVYGGDMTKLDAFSINVLCNPEVIAVNLDPLGQCARVVNVSDDVCILVKDLEDGSKAIGLCNRGEDAADVRVKWADLGIAGSQSVRDVWTQKDLGTFAAEFSVPVRRHGVFLIKVGTTAVIAPTSSRLEPFRPAEAEDSRMAVSQR